MYKYLHVAYYQLLQLVFSFSKHHPGHYSKFLYHLRFVSSGSTCPWHRTSLAMDTFT